jgi:hypothetical protein
MFYRPENKEELFNLRHVSAQNVIEHIFGVLKQHFHILLLPPAYAMEIQAQIPAALCMLHNFIRVHDPIQSRTRTRVSALLSVLLVLEVPRTRV